MTIAPILLGIFILVVTVYVIKYVIRKIRYRRDCRKISDSYRNNQDLLEK